MVAPILKNRTAIVTGASQGLGYEIAAAFLKEGASVCICARNETALADAQTKLLPLVSSQQELVVECCDVSLERDVQRVVSSAAARFGDKIDILVNNAGIHGPKGPTEEVNWEEWVKAVQINLFGSVLMTRSVIPLMRRNNYGKILQLSGGGATQPNPRFSAYAASKAAVVRFAESLAEDLRDNHIDVNCIAPGALNTRFLDELLNAGPDKIGADNYKRALEQKLNGGAPLERPVALCVFLASKLSDGITGKLISALWDNWEQFPQYKEDLSRSDIYTLRRIIGKDRGITWGDK